MIHVILGRDVLSGLNFYEGPEAMGFWQDLKGRYRSPTARFTSLVREDVALPEASRSSSPYDLVLLGPEDLDRLQAFLTQHYAASPPLSPRDIHVAAVRDGALRGSVRLTAAKGLFEGHAVYTIDCLCVHPEDRAQQMASRLLATLHRYGVPRGYRYHVFLKEGRPLPGLPPLYSSTYVFRRRALKESSNPPTVIPTALAYRLLAAYRSVRPDVFFLGSDTPNQTWWFWKRGPAWALACVQDAYQCHPEGGRIGMWTAFFRSEDATRAFNEMVDAAPFAWSWTDRVFVEDMAGWREDGPFHWYTYQWSTSLVPGSNYGILVV